LNLKGDQTTIDQISDILKLGGIEWKPIRCNKGVARMSAAICGIDTKEVPDIALLIRAALA
jgi:hypothetical protein